MDSAKGNCISTADLNWNKKNLIGEGKFGSVYQTVWFTCDEDGKEEEYTVAVKSPHGVNRETILDERDIKSELWHENIVNILGFVQLNNNRKVALVFEYTDEGTVYDYIWDRRDEGGATVDMMMGIASDIAKGMKYLHANSYVHGDLALHNCIMDADGNVKVGDLGLYEDRNECCYFADSMNMTGSTPCPVRWMAPENLPFKYSTKPQMIRKAHTKSYKGDVWAFGVVLYELWTRAAHPFDKCDDQLVCKHVLDGGTAATWNSRFQMRSSVKKLMQRCWKFNPNERPTFSSIVGDFENWIGDESMDSYSDDDADDYAYLH